MKEFDIETFDLIGGGHTILIEANAGTGKTYNIQHLYRRYVEELGYKPSEILVVTFTKAATAELKDRIRKVLSERLDKVTDAQKQKNLKRAALLFDEAAISTIHGFCQWALKDYAFESGVSFENELSDDGGGLVEEIVKDFVRSIQTPSTVLPVPLENLVTYASVCLKQPQPTVRDDGPDYSVADLKRIVAETPIPRNKSGFKNALQELKDSLDESGDEVFLQKLKHGDLIDGTAQKNAPELAAAIQAFFEREKMVFLQKLRAYLFDGQTGLAARKKKTSVIGFDDLLVNLRDVLGGDSDSPLANRLRQTYKVVLVDEFQDTDPIQYEIFRVAFAREGWKLYLIGDPKQAIYGFRGGDVYTYLEAKARVKQDDRYTLTKNYRSEAKIIEAVNGLFGIADVFGEKEIPYPSSSCAGHSKYELLLKGETIEKPARLIWLSGDQDKPVNKGRAGQAFFMETVRQITDLLGSSDYKLRLRGEPEARGIEPGDIAVFLGKNEDCQTLKALLSVRGVPAIIYKSGNVFASQAAKDLCCALVAVLSPRNLGLLKALLMIPWFKKSNAELVGMEGEQATELSGKCAEFRGLWQRQGIYEAVSAVIDFSGMLENVGQLESSERYLVNTRHILEILQAEEREKGLSPEKLLRVLSERIAGASEDKNESYEERLESDSRAIKIMTVHKCKGLQFPITICPAVTLGSSEAHKSNFLRDVVFDPASRGRVYPVSGKAKEEFDPRIWHESLTEDTRKLYVTFTRAENLCIVVAGNVYIGTSGVAKTAFNRLGKIRGADFSPSDFSPAGIQQPFGDVFEVFPKTLEQMNGDPIAEYQAPKNQVDLQGPREQPKVGRGFAIMSYSGLVTHNYENPDRPDGAADETKSEDTLPGGADTGKSLHLIFEDIDFQKETAEQIPIVRRGMERFGLSLEDGRLERVQELIDRTLSIQLDAGFALKELALGDLRKEWKFFFPVRGAVDLEPFLAAGLKFANEHDQRTGFMTGSIDLVFRTDGRYYFADWKSDSLPDYSAEYLDGKMIRTAYLFQAMVYSVALYRHLRKCIPNFVFARNFGGGYYLFLRGLGKDKGIYRFTPTEIDVRRFAKALGGEELQ